MNVLYNVSSCEMVQKVFWAMEMPFDPIVGLFTQCVADVLCLETLKHGTSFKNYLNIRVYGADPSYGGKIGGSSSVSNPKYLDSSKEYFYMFKDSGVISLEYLPIRMQIDGIKEVLNAYKRDISLDESWMTSYMSIPLRSRLHATISGSSGEGSLLMGALHVILSFFTPTVNLRFIPEKLNLSRYKNVKAISSNELERESNRFQEDVEYAGMAWKTKKAIKTSHIGLRGILKQGFKGDVLQRMKDNPRKCLFGAIRLIALGVLLGALFSKLTDSK